MNVVPIKVELLDFMGTDLDVVNAARVSFAKESDWANAEWDHPNFEEPNYLKESDVKLINYLAKHNHWSPFAHCFLKFRIKAPIFAARQFVKHQIGLAWNEESRRYIDSEPEFYIPEVFHGRPENAKQGASTVEVFIPAFHRARNVDGWADVTSPKDYCDQALEYYNYLLALGVAPEEARMFLPLNTMTNWIWSGSLFAFARVVNLRTDGHAQKAATQEVAQEIAKHLKELFPVSYEALCKSNQ